MHPSHIERSGPAIPGEAELGKPLVRPAGNDGLASRVARGMVVKAPFRTGLGVAAWPDAQVDRVDRLVVGGGMLSQRRAQGIDIEATRGQRILDTTPPAAMGCLQAQMR